MKKRISFLSILKAEHLKTKRNVSVWLMILFPVIITVGVDIFILYEARESFGIKTIVYNYNPWIGILGQSVFQFYAMLYPLIISVFCYSYLDLEYKNHSFKQLFTLPVNRNKIYLAKVFYIVETVFISVCIAYLLFLLSGYLMCSIIPGYGFQDYDIRCLLLIYFFRLLVGVLSIALIQFFFGLIFKNFVVPVGLACLGTIFSLVAIRWKYIDFIPYSSIYSAYEKFMSETTILFGRVEISNVIYIAVFMLISCLVFRKIRI